MLVSFYVVLETFHTKLSLRALSLGGSLLLNQLLIVPLREKETELHSKETVVGTKERDESKRVDHTQERDVVLAVGGGGSQQQILTCFDKMATMQRLVVSVVLQCQSSYGSGEDGAARLRPIRVVCCDGD
jgi:hypothetical protein